MKKKLFSILAIAASIVACNKDIDAPEAPEADASNLVVNVTLPETKLGYTEAADGSYKATFAESDEIWAYFFNAEGAMCGAGGTQLPIGFISDDGKSATFFATKVEVPADAAKLVVYLANTGAAANYNGLLNKVASDIMLDLSTQANLAAAQKNQVICGSIPVSELSKDQGKLIASIPVAYKTSLIKFELALPADVEIDKAQTTVALVSDAIHSKVHLLAGESGPNSVKEGITLNVISVDNNKVTAAACVWAADDLNCNIAVTCGETVYAVDFKPAKAIEAGKVYTVARELKNVSTVKRWANDDAGEAVFAGGSAAVEHDFLKYADGKITWAANETGRPRTATIVFDGGAKFELTQIAEKDFKGDAEFVSKVFAGAGSLVPAKDPSTIAVKIADPRTSEELTAADGNKYTNNIGITGIYGTAVLDACVKIDYEAMTAKVGILLDTRDGAGQEVNGKFATFNPCLATLSATAWGKNWKFDETEQGNPDYSYLWFNLEEDLKTCLYRNRTSADIQLQTLSQYSSTTMNAIIGFGVVLSSTNVFTHDTVSGYAQVFQINPANTPGIHFVLK